MLKNIPPILSPELLKVLAEMGHSDRICIGDGNFPGARMAKAKNAIFVSADGHGVPELLDAILQVIPLDTYVEKPAILMEKMDCDKDLVIPVWDKYKSIIAKYDDRGAAAVGNMPAVQHGFIRKSHRGQGADQQRRCQNAENQPFFHNNVLSFSEELGVRSEELWCPCGTFIHHRRRYRNS